MNVTVLGAGPAYTNRAGATGAAYLVERQGSSILLDLGQGSFPALAQAVDPCDLDGVLISHLHPDHFVDLVALRHYLRYEFDPPRRVAIHGPRGLTDRLDGLHAQPGFCDGVFDVSELTPGVRSIGRFEIEARRVTHTEDSFAFRVGDRERPGLVYSGDCAVAQDLGPLIRPDDTLLVEISFGAGPVPPGAQHLAGPEIGALAADRRPGRVLLTHLQMGFEPADAIESVRRLFDGPVDLVEPGFRTTV